MKLGKLVVLGAALSMTAGACADGDGSNDPDARPTFDAAAQADADPGQPDAGAQADAMPPDAMDPDAAPPTPSEQIGMARAAADGTVSIDLEGVYVTYVKAASGVDGAGFFVQHEQTGPALFIAVDATTLTPVPAVGDEVTLTVTEMADLNGARSASAISGLTVASSGNDLSGLVQDLSAATDVVSAIGSYEHELVTVTGTVADVFGSAGTGNVQAVIETAGITGEANLLLRMPAALADTLDIANACTFTAGPTPLWRFNPQAQVSAGVAGDIAIATCPEPTVVSAVPASATELVVNFDRLIGTVNADGSEFTFDNGLTAVAAVASGRTVTLTTTPQVIGTTYTVTVAATVLDTRGSGVNGAANTAMFQAFEVPAILRINEVGANIDPNCDLMELRVMVTGQLGGITVEERGAVVHTFPSMGVTAGDIIVLHFDANDCNETNAVDETTAKNAQDNATHPRNYDSAWDFYTTDGGLTRTNNVFGLKSAVGDFLDALLAWDATSTTTAGGTNSSAAEVATAGHWVIVGGGVPTNGFVDADFNDNAAIDLDGSNTVAGDSIQRNDDDDNNDKDDWVYTAPSWGLPNTGQLVP